MVTSEEHLLERFLSLDHGDFGASSEYAAILLHKTLRDQPRIAILGAPGAGKTTLLQYVGLAYAKACAGEKRLRERKCHKRRLSATKWRLPIFVPLGTIAKRLAETLPDGRPPSIVDAVSQTLPPDLEGDIRSFFVDRLKKGRCVVLLDGLDEVPTDEEFRAVVRAIESLAVAYHKNQFIVTSRIAGWRTGIQADFRLTYVSDLTDDQVEFFVDTWCSAVELNSVVGSIKDESETDRTNRERRAHGRAAQLKTALGENPGIRQLATNPMLLSIIALVHHSRTSLPQDRSKLYADCSKILLEQWDIVRGLRVDDTDLKFDQKEAIMRRLAYAMHTGEIGTVGGGREATRGEVEKLVSELLPLLGGQSASASHLLQILIERSGLIIERRRDVLSFAHLTFQEYFAARYLSRGDRDEYRDFLLQPERVCSDWWRETILLYSGMLNDSSEFIRRLHESPVLDLTRMRTRLSGWCLGEAVQIKQEQVRQQVAEDLLRIRSRWSITKAAVLQPEVITYLIRWSKGEEWYPNAIISSVRGASAVGQIALMAEVAHMLENPRIELIAGALKALPSLPPSAVKANVDTIVPTLLHHKNPEVSRLALYAMGILDKSIVAKTAIKILSDEYSLDLLGLRLCRYLGKELANDERLVTLLNELSTQPSPDWRVREEIARIFTFIYPRASEAFVQLFFALLSDSDPDVRREANRSLTAILRVKPSDVILVNTISLLKHQDPQVRRAAAAALGELDREAVVRHQIVAQLAQLFADKERLVSVAAAAALQKLSQNNLASEIASVCTAALENPEKSSCAIRMLSHFKTLHGTGMFEQCLLRGLESRNAQTRREAAAAAGELGKERAQQLFISKLLELAQDRDKHVRANAIVSLASLQSDDPTPQLLSIVEAGLNDRNDYVITAACRAAGLLRIRAADFVGKLLEILRRKPPGFHLGPRALIFMFRRLRFEHYFFSSSFEGDEFEQHNYWKAAAATLSTIKLPDPELVISELGAMAVQMESGSPLIVPYLVGAIASIGSRHTSMAALQVIFDIAKRFGEPGQRRYPIELMTHEAIFMSPMYVWQAQRLDFGYAALLVSKSLPPREVIGLFRTVLEDNSYGARLLVLQIVGALNASVTSELYPSVMKHLTDEEEQIRTAAWKLVQALSVNRGLWETDPSLYQQESTEIVSVGKE